MKEPKELGFVFQEINLDEAKTLVSAGDGKYSDLLIMLSKKLPEMEQNNLNLPHSERKSFAFALPGNKEMEEKERRGLCHTLNLRMRRFGVNWKVHYSGNKKLFVCVPMEKNSAIKSKLAPNGMAPKMTPTEFGKSVSELKSKGLGVAEISHKLNVPPHRVSYIYYQKNLRRKGIKPDGARGIPPNGKLSAKELVKIALELFSFSQIPMGKGEDARGFRKTISIVGLQDLHLVEREVSAALGLKKGAAYFMAKHGVQNVDKEIAALRLDLKSKGVIQ